MEEEAGRGAAAGGSGCGKRRVGGARSSQRCSLQGAEQKRLQGEESAVTCSGGKAERGRGGGGGDGGAVQCTGTPQRKMSAHGSGSARVCFCAPRVFAHFGFGFASRRARFVGAAPTPAATLAAARARRNLHSAVEHLRGLAGVAGVPAVTRGRRRRRKRSE